MSKNTNIDILCVKIDDLKQDLQDFKIDIKDSIHTVNQDVKKNTEFRLKVNGIVMIIGAIAGFIATGVLWVIGKIFWK